MNPSTDLRIRSMMRSMTEVILPAIPAENSLATEQAQLLLGQLAVMLEQKGLEPAMVLREKRSLIDLADSLLEASDGGEKTAKAAKALLAIKDKSSVEALSFAIEELLLASGIDGSEAFKEASHRLVLEHSSITNELNRAWYKGMNFDANPDSLPSIDELVAK